MKLEIMSVSSGVKNKTAQKLLMISALFVFCVMRLPFSLSNSVIPSLVFSCYIVYMYKMYYGSVLLPLLCFLQIPEHLPACPFGMIPGLSVL